MLTVTYCLALQCDFTRASELAYQMLAEVDSYQLQFALTSRRLERRVRRTWNATVLLRRPTLARSRRCGPCISHPHHLLNARVLRSSLFMELARFEDAYKQVRSPVEDAATPAMHGEYIATRALALSLLGLDDEALDVATTARNTSISSEVHVLTSGVSAIVAARNGDDVQASRLIDNARARRTWVPVICCLRASPGVVRKSTRKTGRRSAAPGVVVCSIQ